MPLPGSPSIRSPRAITPPMAIPLPRPLANVMMSGVTPCAPMPQKCSPVRPHAVCTSSEMSSAPRSRRTAAYSPRSPSGGMVNPPTPCTGSAIRQATSPAVAVAQHVPQVLDARGGVLGVAQPGEGGQLAVRAVQVVHGERGQRRALPRTVAGDGDRPEGPAVIAVAQREHLVGPAGRGGQHQRGLVGLGAGVGEEHLGVLDPGQAGQLLGQLHLVADQVQGGRVHHAGVQLALDRLADLGHVVAQHVGQDPAEEIQVAAAVSVGDAAAAAAGEFQRLGVVEREPVGDDAAVPLEEFRHAPSLAEHPAPRTPTQCYQ